MQKELRSRINRLAHELGQRHENKIRDRLMKELEAVAAAGATLPELNAALENLIQNERNKNGN